VNIRRNDVTFLIESELDLKKAYPWLGRVGSELRGLLYPELRGFLTRTQWRKRKDLKAKIRRRRAERGEP